jgi:ABC-type uncharacterized transport system involved in gliding motility auxiliary subunit
MAFQWFKSRQGKYTGYAVAYIVVIVLVLAAVNFLANRYPKTYDATSNRQFSLSDQTIKLVKGLKQDVRATYFGDSSSFAGARDLLDQYATYSTKFHADYLDPVRKPQQARAAGYRSDSAVVLSAGDKKEGAKALSEEEITGALVRALKTGDRNVCFLSAAGEHSIEDSSPNGYSTAKALLERDNYMTRTLTPKGTAPEEGKSLSVGQAPASAAFEVPKDCTVLVVGGPQTDYPAPVVTAIKTYVEGGGRALIMLDEPLKIGRGESASENPELVKQLDSWGVVMNKDLALDLSGLGQLFGLGPEMPLIAQYPQHVITQPLTRLPTVFPLSRTIDVKPDASGKVEKLIDTMPESVATTQIAASGQVDPSKGRKGPLSLAVAVTLSGSNAGRVIVMGTSQWAANSLLGSRRIANGDLFGNMVNWLSSDEEMISIRPKTSEDRPLNITIQKLNLLFWLSVIIFPLAIVGLGLGTWWQRR